MSTTAWYLKKTDGGVYGPVPLLELKAWAMDGRVAPDDMLSEDRAAWFPAPRLADLAMEYTAKFSTGATYGPVHVRALGDLIAEGDLPLDVPVFKGEEGEARPAGLLVLAYLLRERDPAQDLAPDLVDALNQFKAEKVQWLEEKKELTSRQQELEKERQSARDTSQEDVLRQQLDDRTRQFETLAAEREAEREAQGKREADALKKVQEREAEWDSKRLALKEQNQALTAERDQLATDLKDREATLDALNRKVAVLEADSTGTDHAAELAKVQDALETQQRRADDLQTKWEAAQEKMAGLKKDHDTEAAVLERTRELQAALDEERDRNQKKESRLQARLNELEGQLKENVTATVRSKQTPPVEAGTAAVNESNAVVRSALTRARESSLHSAAAQHAPRPLAQRSAMIRKASSPPPRPKRAPGRPGGGRPL